jgi:hypothetical protein
LQQKISKTISNDYFVCVDWLFLIYVSLKNLSLVWRRHHYRWRTANFRPMLGAWGLWAGRDLHRATPAVTRDIGFSGLIRRTAPFSRLFRIISLLHSSILRRISFNFMAQYLMFRFYKFHNFVFRISNFFGLSTTEETWLVEMRIWCIKIGIVSVLHYPDPHVCVDFL